MVAQPDRMSFDNAWIMKQRKAALSQIPRGGDEKGYILPMWPWDEMIGVVTEKSEEEKLDAKNAAFENFMLDDEEDGKNASPKKKTSNKRQSPTRAKNNRNRGKAGKEEPPEEKPKPKKVKLKADNIVLEVFDKFLKEFDQFWAKDLMNKRNKTTFGEIREFIADSKLPNLTYDRYMFLDPDPETKELQYSAWKRRAVEDIKKFPPPKRLLEATKERLLDALMEIKANIMATAEERRLELESRHKKELTIADYKEEASKGDADAQYMLGVCFHHGKGCDVDMEGAVNWYMMSAEKNHVTAQCALGWCYEAGKGVEQDVEKSFYWYQKSAEGGYAIAQRNTALNYEYGNGTEKDVKKAQEWFQIAAKGGDEWSAHTLSFWDNRHNKGIATSAEGNAETQAEEEKKVKIDPALAKTAARVQANLAQDGKTLGSPKPSLNRMSSQKTAKRGGVFGQQRPTSKDGSRPQSRAGKNSRPGSSAGPQNSKSKGAASSPKSKGSPKARRAGSIMKK